MSKELEYLYDIWGETYTDWQYDPVTMDIFYEDDERFLAIEKALKRNKPLKLNHKENNGIMAVGTCGNCRGLVREVNGNYCSLCGQRLDWASD